MIRDAGRVFDSKCKSRKHKVEVTLAGFEEARNVYVIDDFCCWFPGAQPMERQGRTWKRTLYLYEGDYRYVFAIDGYTWLGDPDNPVTARNPSGTECSLFMVGRELLEAPISRNDGKIELEGLYHDQTPRFLDVNKDEALFRFRAKKGDLTQAVLVLKGKEAVEKEFEMRRSWEDKYFEYYEHAAHIESYPLEYSFKARDGNVTVYFTSSGASPDPRASADFVLDKSSSVFEVPGWARGAVFYQIFPDRFYNGDRTNDPPRVTKWGDKPKRNNFFGGDLKGIIEKMDHLESLGIDAIYLTPIFSSNSNHKYDVYDYFRVDPHFGDENTLRRLVKEAHKRGIKVILDAVFNHTSYEFWAFKDVLKNQEKSRYVNWYFMKKFPIEGRALTKAVSRLPFTSEFRYLLRFKFPPPYETFAGVPFMPKLNLLNPETAEYFMNVAEHWIREADVDGWRFDVAFGVPYEFWTKLRARLKELKPDVYLLGEFGNGNPDPSAWVGPEAFDAVMNYPLRSIILDFVVFERLGVEEFHRRLMELMGKLPEKALYVMYNLLGSHDTPRLLTLCKGDAKKAKLAILLQMTLPGVPAVYYGDEVGLLGRRDPDCRRTMPWNAGEWNTELLTYYEQLIRARKEHPSLTLGGFEPLLKDDTKSAYVFQRKHKGESTVISVNNGVYPAEVSFKSNKPFLEVLTGTTYEPVKNFVEVTMPPKQGCLLVEKRK